MPVSSFWFFRIHYLKTVFLCFYSIAVSVAGTFGIFLPWCFIYFYSRFVLWLWAIAGHINWASVAVYKALIAASNNGLPRRPKIPRPASLANL